MNLEKERSEPRPFPLKAGLRNKVPSSEYGCLHKCKLKTSKSLVKFKDLDSSFEMDFLKNTEGFFRETEVYIADHPTLRPLSSSPNK